MDSETNSRKEALKSLAKGALIILLGSIISKILGYVYRIIVARTGVEDYGLLSLGLAITGFLVVIATFGFDWVATRFVPEYVEKKEEQKLSKFITSINQMGLLFGVVLGGILFFLADWISIKFFGDQRLGIILKILAFAIPLTASRNIIIGIMKGFKDVNTEFYSRFILENIGKVVFVIFFIFLGLNFIGPALAYTVAIGLSAIVAYIYLKKKTTKVLFSKFKFNSEKLIYAWPLVFNTFLVLILSWIDSLMIGGYLNVGEVGIYNAALPLAMIMTMFPKSIMTIFLPVITSLYTKKNMEYKTIFKSITKWIFFLNLFFLGLLIAFPEEILGILFGEQYRIGATALRILAIGFFVESITLFAPRELLLLEHKRKTIFGITLTAVIVDIVLNVLLIPKYGINGAGISTAIALALMGILAYAFARKDHGIRIFDTKYLRGIIAIIIATVIVDYITTAINYSGIIIPIIALGIFGIIYAILVLISKSLDKDDVEIVKSIERKLGIKECWIDKILDRFS